MHVWIEPAENETVQQRNERLVMHGMRCGKETVAQLAMHIGLTGYGAVSVTERVIERLREQGRVKPAKYGWQPA